MVAAYLIALALGMTAVPFPILSAIDKACGDDNECKADVLTYAQAESGMSEHPHPFSADSRAGISCGLLQEPCRIVHRATLEGQVLYWRNLRDWSKRACAAAGLPPEEGLSALASGSCSRGRTLARGRYETAQAALWAVSVGLTVDTTRR